MGQCTSKQALSQLEMRVALAEERCAVAELKAASIEAALFNLQTEVAAMRRVEKPVIESVWWALSWIPDGVAVPFEWKDKTYFRNSKNHLWEVCKIPLSPDEAKLVISEIEKATPSCPWWWGGSERLADRWRAHNGKRYIRGCTGPHPHQVTSDVWEITL